MSPLKIYKIFNRKVAIPKKHRFSLYSLNTVNSNCLTAQRKLPMTGFEPGQLISEATAT